MILRPRRPRPSVFSVLLMSFGAGVAVGSVLIRGASALPELEAAAVFGAWVWVLHTLAQS